LKGFLVAKKVSRVVFESYEMGKRVCLDGVPVLSVLVSCLELP